jgi:hypothetical protein
MVANKLATQIVTYFNCTDVTPSKQQKHTSSRRTINRIQPSILIHHLVTCSDRQLSGTTRRATELMPYRYAWLSYRPTKLHLYKRVAYWCISFFFKWPLQNSMIMDNREAILWRLWLHYRLRWIHLVHQVHQPCSVCTRVKASYGER